jgi:hypothetical protein
MPYLSASVTNIAGQAKAIPAELLPKYEKRVVRMKVVAM